jgi:hypothetical protein
MRTFNPLLLRQLEGRIALDAKQPLEEEPGPNLLSVCPA